MNIAVFGSSGAIGCALISKLRGQYPIASIHAFSRKQDAIDGVIHHQLDFLDESAVENAMKTATHQAPFNIVLVATGMLHSDECQPEKSLKTLNANSMQRLFEVNTVIPALIAKYALPRLSKQSNTIFAALSARVGSISDNRLGGWYAYRMSKAALNMFIKSASIEIARTHKQAVVVGLHPGTVKSNLSAPFQANVAKEKLFTPDYSAEQLLSVLLSLTAQDSGKCFAWDGKEIQP